jgi:hypothetical protein
MFFIQLVVRWLQTNDSEDTGHPTEDLRQSGIFFLDNG